jgi:dsDNA-specific endonuclease/ATPase MutS2
MRVLEGEVEGEKLVTRHILEQTQRNGDDLAALKARVDHLSIDVALVRGAVTGHTALLNVLVQDVGQLRQEMGGTRRDIGQLHQEVQRNIGALHRDIQQDMGALRQEMQQDVGALRQEIQQDMAALRQEMQRDMGELRQEMRQDMGALRQDMGTMRADIAAIRTALAPRDRPGVD